MEGMRKFLTCDQIIKKTVASDLWHEQKYPNEWTLHLIGWTQSLSHGLYKYVMNLLE